MPSPPHLIIVIMAVPQYAEGASESETCAEPMGSVATSFYGAGRAGCPLLDQAVVDQVAGQVIRTTASLAPPCSLHTVSTKDEMASIPKWSNMLVLTLCLYTPLTLNMVCCMPY